MQEQLMREMQDRLTSTVRAMAPEALLRTWVPLTMKGFEEMQETLWMMAGARRD